MSDAALPRAPVSATPESDRPDGEAVARAFARCFAGADGALALDHLRRITFERVLAPEVGEAALRDLEGQRRLAANLLALIRRGRAGD
ncbi:hypothetical protein [Rhodovibrio salinarum]|uniref:Bbp19 family protein n=1 Tax=Rhodovibrio salinarum TaxID=1087 RepID=UPI0012DD18CE|nr:hypothetical protein [Rhodovibrio salinarum]